MRTLASIIQLNSIVKTKLLKMNRYRISDIGMVDKDMLNICV